jgi:hypothetical protein
VVHSNEKKIARLEVIRDLLASFDYPHKDHKLVRADDLVLFPWSEEAHREGKIAK